MYTDSTINFACEGFWQFTQKLLAESVINCYPSNKWESLSMWTIHVKCNHWNTNPDPKTKHLILQFAERIQQMALDKILYDVSIFWQKSLYFIMISEKYHIKTSLI